VTVEVLDALLDSWDRNNTILKNLGLALPEGDVGRLDGQEGRGLTVHGKNPMPIADCRMPKSKGVHGGFPTTPLISAFGIGQSAFDSSRTP